MPQSSDVPRQVPSVVTEPGTAEYASASDVTEPSPEICRNCRFWAKVESHYGQCRIRAPIMNNQLVHFIDDLETEWAVWPLVSADSWCGEFQAGPEATKQHRSRDGADS